MPSLPESERSANGWQVDRFDLAPGDFHELPVPDHITRSAWVSRPRSAAIVLGSTQDEALIDPAAAARRGIDVVRRHSGGGAVLVVPGDLCWVDLVVGRDDPLWHDDVGRAMYWVGELWQAALADLGVTTSVHRGPMVRTPMSEVVCFAGVGPGELVGEGGAKVVGISQRRTRHWARFQTAALVHWRPDDVAGLLAAPPARLRDELAQVASGTGRSASDLEAALIGRLPTLGVMVGENVT